MAGRRITGMRLDEILGEEGTDKLLAELGPDPEGETATDRYFEGQRRADDWYRKVAAVMSAFTDPGPCPRVHWAARERLRQEWPTLYNALKELCE